MKKIKSLTKKLLSKKYYGIFAEIYNRRSSSFSLRVNFNLPDSISDFFVWSPYVKKTYFVAENVRALIKGEKIKVTHYFRFYSKDGFLLREDSHHSDDFFCRIDIMKTNLSSGYCSFTHHVEAGETAQEGLFTSNLKNDRKVVCEQNRGYCIYYPHTESSLGSMMHGNFGGISNNNTLLARQRAEHLYTPSYMFKSHNNYDLVFNNPTPRKVKVKIICNSTDDSIEKHINPLGTCAVRINGYTGALTFKSRLPICRPIIFKNPDCRYSSDFDVLHS